MALNVQIIPERNRFSEKNTMQDAKRPMAVISEVCPIISPLLFLNP